MLSLVSGLFRRLRVKEGVQAGLSVCRCVGCEKKSNYVNMAFFYSAHGTGLMHHTEKGRKDGLVVKAENWVQFPISCVTLGKSHVP